MHATYSKLCRHQPGCQRRTRRGQRRPLGQAPKGSLTMAPSLTDRQNSPSPA